MKDKNLFYGVLFVSGVIAILLIQYSHPDTRFSKDWMGFYSPAHCAECGNTKLFHSPAFPDLKTCKQWGQAILEGRKDTEDTFMCGFKCVEQNGDYICKSKVDN